MSSFVSLVEGHLQPTALRAQAIGQVVTITALEMQSSAGVGRRTDHAIIFGQGPILSYLSLNLSRLPFAKFNLQVEAAGESAAGRWPRLAIALDDLGNIVRELAIESTDFRRYDFGLIDAAGRSTLYLIFTNDYWNSVTGEDVNLKIRQAEYAGVTKSDTTVIAGRRAVLEWHPNREPDLAGYQVYMGLQSRKYSSPIEVRNGTRHEFSVDPGYTYFFSVRAFDNAGNVSEYSSEVIAYIQADSGSALLSDLNSDGRCDATDRAVLDAAMGSRCNRNRYDSRADLNRDCRVDGMDLILFNKNCKNPS